MDALTDQTFNAGEWTNISTGTGSATFNGDGSVTIAHGSAAGGIQRLFTGMVHPWLLMVLRTVTYVGTNRVRVIIRNASDSVTLDAFYSYGTAAFASDPHGNFVQAFAAQDNSDNQTLVQLKTDASSGQSFTIQRFDMLDLADLPAGGGAGGAVAHLIRRI